VLAKWNAKGIDLGHEIPQNRVTAQKMFDERDRRILELLQEDADRPIAEIAAAVSLSTSPCWRRIKRLEESGLIARRVVIVDRLKANLPLTVFVGVKAPRHSQAWLEAFRDLIRDIPEIVEAYRLTGEVDYLLRLVVPDIPTYDRVYKDLIARLEFSHQRRERGGLAPPGRRQRRRANR
jgi:Lrp/AsnC family transcriptional regulator